MKTFLFISLLVLALGCVEATLVDDKDVRELVAESDHILIAAVIKVDLIDASGKELAGFEAETGPGIPNTLRLHLRPIDNGVLKTGKQPIPKAIIVELWREWHYSLSQWKHLEGREMIFLLKGDKYTWVYPKDFILPISARGEIERLIREPLSKPK